jgi:glycosyltransferase involved in cell wall biosynthesis
LPWQAILKFMSRIFNHVYARVWLAANRFSVRAYQSQLKKIIQASGSRLVVIFPPGLGWKIQLFQRPQQLALALARQGALVFYMEPVHPTSTRGFHSYSENLFLCHVPPQAFRVLAEPHVHVMTWNARAVQDFDRPRVIYDYVDDLEAFEGDRRRLENDHQAVLATAWLVLATANRLFQEVLAVRPDTLYVPNGVDTRHFSQASRTGSVPAPDDLAPILAQKKPVIGYHGALAPWFDYALFQEVALQRQDLNFVLIGPQMGSSLQDSGLLKLKNVHWLGQKTYPELPSYVSNFDIAVIPFKLNEITHATSPIKLYEYLAAGKPVVITPMQESMRLNAALVAQGVEDFCRKIDRALILKSDPVYLNELNQMAQENTWDKRARQILQALHNHPKGINRS